MSKNIIHESNLKTFMSRVNKLVLGKSTSDEFYGRVTLVKPADRTKTVAAYRNRAGYGTRRFKLTDSKLIKNGRYTLRTLRAKLTKAVV